jgi:hypothetical protein
MSNLIEFDINKKDLNLIKKRKSEHNRKYYNKTKKNNKNKSLANESSIATDTQEDNLINSNFNSSFDQSIIDKNENFDDPFFNVDKNRNNKSCIELNLSSESSDDDLNLSYSNQFNEQEEFDVDDSDEFIYKDSNIKSKEIFTSLLALKFKHKFSDLAMDDLIKLIKIMLPPSNNFPKTYKAIEKYFNIDPISNDFNLCSKCKSIINANDKNNKSKICSSCSNNELIQFTVYNLKPQLENILKNKSYLNQIIKSNKQRTFQKQNELIATPLDGTLHRNLPKDLENQISISLNINSDGAPIVKAKHFAIWPVLATIVELDQSSREKFQNVLILGIWLHSSKPEYDKFFQVVFDQFENLKDLEIGSGLKLKIFSIKNFMLFSFNF